MSELYEDLLKDSSESFEDGNYFLLTITELELGTTYPLEFRWKYKDGTSGKDWSAVYNITTPGSTVPNEPDLDPGDVVGGAGFISVTWNGNDATNNPIQNIDRVDIHIAGTSFGDGTKPAGSFKTAGTQTFTAEPGIYIVQLKAIRVDGATSFFSSGRTVTVTAIEEPIEAPVVPNGFSARAILGGIELTWNGTYSGGAAWSGFQAVNVYAGTSATATGGTYIKVGQMTANKTTNKIVIPIDGTYVKYGSPAYIHASSINKATPPAESSISANVASATPSQVVNTDLIDAIISEAKIALGAITETKIANDAITTPKIVSGAITAGKIAALTITADKIAANTIDIGKLAANTISVGNLSAGDISATSFIRAGTAGSARVEIASTTVGSVLPGLTVYSSDGVTQLLRAPLTGGLTITGSLTATQISTSSGDFSVSTSGILTARSANIDGTIKATAGYIGGTTSGIYIAAGAIQNDSSGSQFKLDNTGKARFGSSSGNAIIIDPTAGNGGYYIYHTSGGQSGSASGIFSVSTSGNLTSTSGSIGGWTIGSTTLTGGATTLNSNGSISGASMSAATITGSTITGGLIRTGSTGARIEISGSDQGTNPNSIQFMNPAGAPVTHIVPMNIGGTQYGLLMHYGGNADASGGSYPQIYIGSGNISMSARQFAGGSSSTMAVSDLAATISVQNGATINLSGGNITFGTTTGQVMEYINSSGNLRIGSNITRLQADGQIFANTLGVAAGTTLVQSAGGFIKVSSSSRRYKENIVEIDKSGYLNTITQLKPVTFNYKQEVSPDDYEVLVSGLIAEDVDQIENLRTVVNYNIEGLPESVSYDRLSALIVLAIKEIKDKLESIEQRLDALEG